MQMLGPEANMELSEALRKVNGHYLQQRRQYEYDQIDLLLSNFGFRYSPETAITV